MTFHRSHIRVIAWLGLLALPAATLAPAGECWGACQSTEPAAQGCCCGPTSCGVPDMALESDGCCCSVSEAPAQETAPATPAALSVRVADNGATPDADTITLPDPVGADVSQARHCTAKPPDGSHTFLTICSFLI